MKLDGMGICVTDMPAMIRLDHDIFGFKIQIPAGTVNVFWIKDGTVSMLYPRSEFKKFVSTEFGYAAGANGYFEVALAVENYAEADKAHKDIVSKGGTPVVAPITCPWGQ